ncbi:MAG: zinc-dependent peptidase [Pirellulales bacterium]|nr:zinc-dependent peptidase [Pirellulales bacterium]
MLTWLRGRRRRKLLADPISPIWVKYVELHLDEFTRLPITDQRKLLADMRVIVAEKNWEGCGGLMVNDEMKVVVAAWASLLVLHLEHDYYSRVQSILLYPSGYQGPERQQGALVGPPDARLGEAWYRGPVVLSWEDADRAGRDDDGANVVLHEFAHQLDMLDRVIDGTPPLESRQAYQAWAAVMSAEYKKLAEDWRQGRPTVLDPYGMKDEAEFFAVATEAFFGLPIELAERHPRLYEQLKSYYRQDPAQRRITARQG